MGTLLWTGCGAFEHGSQSVDIEALRNLVRDRTGILLEPVPPPVRQPAMTVLRNTYSGGGTDEQLTVLEFYEPSGAAAAIGHIARSPDGIEVLRRENTVMLYTRADSVPDRTARLRSALEDARTRTD